MENYIFVTLFLVICSYLSHRTVAQNDLSNEFDNHVNEIFSYIYDNSSTKNTDYIPSNAQSTSTTFTETYTFSTESTTKLKDASVDDRKKNVTETTSNTYHGLGWFPTSLTTTTLKTLPPLECPVHENPVNIGPYEVPSHKDLLLQIRSTLDAMIKRYHKKTLTFLKDVKQITKSTKEIEKKCFWDKITYSKCVKHASRRCEIMTKNLVVRFERQRYDLMILAEKYQCNMTALKPDPLLLIQALAAEEAILEYALPGFLRLINSCSAHCSIRVTKEFFEKKPVRHMTDQDLLVRHLLTRKNYIQLLKDPRLNKNGVI